MAQRRISNQGVSLVGLLAAGALIGTGLVMGGKNLVEDMLHFNTLKDTVSPPVFLKIDEPNYPLSTQDSVLAQQQQEFSSLVRGFSYEGMDSELTQIFREHPDQLMRYLSGEYNSPHHTPTNTDRSILSETKRNLQARGLYDMVMEKTRRVHLSGNYVLPKETVENQWANPELVASQYAYGHSAKNPIPQDKLGRGLFQITNETYEDYYKKINYFLDDLKASLTQSQFDYLMSLPDIDILQMNDKKAAELGFTYTTTDKNGNKITHDGFAVKNAYGLTEDSFYKYRLLLAKIAYDAFGGVRGDKDNPSQTLLKPDINTELMLIITVSNILRQHEIESAAERAIYGSDSLSRNLAVEEFIPSSYIAGQGFTSSAYKEELLRQGKNATPESIRKGLVGKMGRYTKNYVESMITREQVLDGYSTTITAEK